MRMNSMKEFWAEFVKEFWEKSIRVILKNLGVISERISEGVNMNILVREIPESISGKMSV